MLRESYPAASKVNSCNLTSLSKLPLAQVELMRRVLKGEKLVAPEDAFSTVRSLPHRQVAAALDRLRQLGLERLLDRKPSQKQRLVVEMIVAVVLQSGWWSLRSL